MIDLNSEFGARVARRLRDEQIIWLTTVDRRANPQPRPVWFLWNEATLLILSQPHAAKVRHIRNNSCVALHFNTDADGGDVTVLLGQAAIGGQVPANEMDSYLAKYSTGIQSLDMTPEQMVKEYSVAIRVTPTSLRGF